ncbi:T9SS type A sorting domain-containing protein [Fluviicola sp.]|uniref:T9SS type A sorting domain-containing protein n=1 Tax=Fluviicola sp. TaxID=1917219 RepID=UPI003D2E03CE
MKTIRKLLFLVMVCTYLPDAYSQLVNNPSFETYSYSSSCGPDYWICQATNWNVLVNTPDVLNSINASVPPNSYSHQPRTGDGNARFAAPPNGMDEYFYGSTQALTAGQTYVVSFWVRQDYYQEGSGSVGMHIGSSVPSSQVNTITPQILITPPSTEYVRAYTCYTAATNGVHYLTFGPFGGGGNGVWLLDDVDVTPLDPTLPLSDANLTIPQALYCTTDAVIANGSNSTNETSYQWDLYEVVNGNEELVYSSGEVTGQAGTFSTANITGFFPHNGECFHLYLSTFGVCKDRTFVDFCYTYPTIDFITDGNPVCENIPINLEVTGDNGWIYTWSTGASGQGMKSIQVTPTIGNSTYTVTVTTPEGCTSTKTVTLNVSSQNNVAPWMDGINGTGEYTYYVSQGDAVFFNSLVSNDHPEEEIEFLSSTTIPSGYSVATPTGAGTVLSLSWVTSFATPTGEYHYYLTADDKNSCNAGIATFDFRIIVVCDQCLVCVEHENRTPSNNPLPPETKAGKCIRAGWSSVVSTGDANVKFIAGKTIDLGTFWDAGPGYEGIIDPTTCVTDCEDCCVDWEGFHFDEHAYYSYMNHSNNDPTDDYFEITDITHPFCAYGAKFFEMHFMDTDNQTNYHSVYGGSITDCCELQSTAPENPIPHSSIFWNGTVEAATGGWADAPNQVYSVQLILHGCNGETEEHYFMLSKNFYEGIVQNDSDSLSQIDNNTTPKDSQETPTTNSNNLDNLSNILEIYPNPATNMLYIRGSKTETTIQLYDEKGRVLTKREKVALNQGYNLEAFSSGKYYCRIYKEDGTYVLKNFIKL